MSPVSGNLSSDPGQIAVRLLEDYITHRRREKEDICKAIDTIHKNTNDWYNELYREFHMAQIKSRGEIDNQMKQELKNKLVKYAGRSSRREAADRSTDYLRTIKDAYENKKLGRGILGQQQWAKADNFPIELIESLNSSLCEFRDKEVNWKEEELQRIREDQYYLPDPSGFSVWLDTLSTLRENIGKQYFDLITKIGCRQQRIGALQDETTSNKST